MKKILFLLALVLSCSNLIVMSQNLLVNPGFETWVSGRPSGWVISNTANIAQNTSIATEGINSCKVNATLTDFNLYQSVAVTPGKTYSFKLSYYIERGDGTDARINSYFRNAAQKAIAMSIEDSLGLKGPGGNLAYFPNLLGAWKTYTYEVVAPPTASTFLFYVRTGTNGTVSWDNCSFSVNSLPTVTVSKTSMTGFTYAPGSGPSAEQSFTVRGVNLTSGITVVAPANYEISVLSGASFAGTSSLTLAQTGGLVNTTTIYIRLKSGLAANPTYNGNVTVTSTGTVAQSISVKGSVAIPPVLINASTASLVGLNYVQNAGPSAQRVFTVSGSGLTSGIVITAPANYEVSLMPGTSFMGSTTFTIAQSSGVVASTPIYVRLKSGLAPATYNGVLSIASTGGTSKIVALSGQVTSTGSVITSTGSLSGFSYILGTGPSAEQFFTVSGTGLTSYIIVNAPANFEISTETGALFSGTSTIYIPQVNGIIGAVNIYTRLAAGLSVATYTGNISVASTGFATQTIGLAANVLLSTAIDDVVLNAGASSVTAYAKSQNIVIDGTSKGDVVSVYSITGMKIKTLLSNGDKIILPVPTSNMYIVKTQYKVMKVIM